MNKFTKDHFIKVLNHLKQTNQNQIPSNEQNVYSNYFSLSQIYRYLDQSKWHELKELEDEYHQQMVLFEKDKIDSISEENLEITRNCIGKKFDFNNLVNVLDSDNDVIDTDNDNNNTLIKSKDGSDTIIVFLRYLI